MMGSSADPGPGPAPPPSLTLPPLSEIDKSIRPDSSSSSSHRVSAGLSLMGGPGSQPRSQFTDPHLHQHSSHSHSHHGMQQPPHYQHQQQQRGQHSHSFPQHPSSVSSSSSSHGGAGPQQYYPHDHHSRHPSSAGSLPDLYMSSSTSAPSTTTTSSLSRADSLSSIEYLHGSHPLHHSHANRHLSGSASGSTTTGSTTGSSFGHSVASGSVSSGGSSSVYLHHSTGLGRANLNAAIRHQRNPHDSAASSTAGSSRTVGDASSTAATDGSQRVNGKSGLTAASGSAGTEQGRNSTKRAAQNRAAQRAFRQRKDLYVRELERKAELLQQAEGKILRLTARNRELEVALASGNPSSSSSLSPQQSPLHSHASPTTGLVCAAGSSSPSGDQEQQQPPQQPHPTLQHSSSREQLDRGGSEWSRNEKPSSLSGRDQEVFNNSSSNHSSHNYPSSLSRATLGRRSASQPMRSAYNASSSPLTNDSLKFHSLKQQLAANQHLSQPHSQPRHLQQQQQHAPSRVDSDFEFENHDPNPHRQLHRHPSEPSLNQNRHGSNSADSGDDLATSGGQNDTHQHYPQDLSRNHGPRRSSVDSRMELTSPIFNNQQSSSSTYRSSNGISTGSQLLPAEYPESSSPPSLAQPYTSNNGGSNSQQQQHERPPLYPIATQVGSRSVPLGSARSWSSGAHQEDGMKPHSPMTTSPVAVRNGGMATSAPSPPRGYRPDSAASRSNDMEYLSDERPETGGDSFDAMSKRSSDGAISWSGSNSSGGRGGGLPGPEPQSSPHAFFGGGPGLRKEASWSSFSAISKGSNDGYNASNGAGGHSPVSLPPVSALAAVAAGRERDIGDDMDMQEAHHHPQSSQHLHQNRDGERQPLGSDVNGNHHRGSMTMIADSPENSSEGRFHNGNTPSSATTAPIPVRQQQYFSPQQHRASPFAPQQQHHHQHHPQQQQQRQNHPLSPANEYSPPTSEMDGVYEHQHQQHQHAHHQAQPRFHNSINPNNQSGIAAGFHEEAMMRSP